MIKADVKRGSFQFSSKNSFLRKIVYTIFIPLIGLCERSKSRNLANDRLSNCIGKPVKPLSLKSKDSRVSVKGSRLKSSKLKRLDAFVLELDPMVEGSSEDSPSLKNEK